MASILKYDVLVLDDKMEYVAGARFEWQWSDNQEVKREKITDAWRAAGWKVARLRIQLANVAGPDAWRRNRVAALDVKNMMLRYRHALPFGFFREKFDCVAKRIDGAIVKYENEPKRPAWRERFRRLFVSPWARRLTE